MIVYESIRRGAIAVAAAALVTTGTAGRAVAHSSGDSLDVAMTAAASAQRNAPVQPDDVRSFRITFADHFGASIVTIRDEEKNSDKVTFETDGSTMYMIGLVTYFQSRDGQWTKFDGVRALKTAAARQHAAGAAKARARKHADERIRELPDSRVDGVLMGAFSVTQHGAFVDKHLPATQTVTTTCWYEKETSRLRRCSAPNVFSMTFDHYNDPANRFTVPAEALHAPDAFPSLMK
jgi:hypothetical protein